jgi:hypothetical protein
MAPSSAVSRSNISRHCIIAAKAPLKARLDRLDLIDE